MNTKKYIYIFISVFLVSCSSPQQQAPTLALQTKKTVSVILPPTWTPTVSLHPTDTAISPATLTFTPLPSVTQLPQTLTSTPALNLPTPDITTTVITPTLTSTVVSDCNFQALEEGVYLHSAPFDEPFSLLPTMIPSVTYQAITYHPTYYELMLDGERVGWADYRLLSVWSDGPGCSSLPLDDRELFEFDNLCFFTTDNRKVEVYHDFDLTEYADTLSGPDIHRIILRYQDVYYANDGLGSRYFYVDVKKVRSFGDCEQIPKAGITTVDSWLYSQPTWPVGKQVANLPAGSLIAIHEGPLQGPKPPDASGSGYWYLVKGPWQQEDPPIGWIWSSNFEIK